ncbi:hypothetical protein GJZ08_23350, partial [Salmonella enterica]|nr:hypothetical protein [Salmonella enterica]EEM4079331.1 hypothetical protein [Salmonella enterica]
MYTTHYREAGVWSYQFSPYDNYKQWKNRIMNKAYGIIWNHSRQAWVVVSELASGQGFILAKNTILAAAVTATISNSFAATSYVSGANIFTSGGQVIGGDTQLVYSGGTAVSVTINSAGIQTVNKGGQTIDTVITNSGIQNVGEAGRAQSTTVSKGGLQRVSSGGLATSTQLMGGAQNVYSGGHVSNTSIYSGGVQ